MHYKDCGFAYVQASQPPHLWWRRLRAARSGALQPQAAHLEEGVQFQDALHACHCRHLGTLSPS